DMAAAGGDAAVGRNYEDMVGALVIETGRWQLADKLLAANAGGKQADSGAGAGAHAGHDSSQMGRYHRSPTIPIFIRGFAAAKTGAPEAEKSIAELQAMRKNIAENGDAYNAKGVEIRELELSALVAASRKNYDEAIELMKRAT